MIYICTTVYCISLNPQQTKKCLKQAIKISGQVSFSHLQYKPTQRMGHIFFVLCSHPTAYCAVCYILTFKKQDWKHSPSPVQLKPQKSNIMWSFFCILLHQIKVIYCTKNGCLMVQVTPPSGKSWQRLHFANPNNYMFIGVHNYGSNHVDVSAVSKLVTTP
jgi:hypothetical protein